MAATNKLLIRGGQVYDHDGDVHHPPVADILIENDRIAAVGPRLATEGNVEIIEASGRLVVPGLINAHYHSHDTLCRGLFEELPLEMWLLYTLPMGQNRSVDEVRARTLVGINNVVAPDGGAHVCAPRQVGPNKGVLFCVILPLEG
jgi:cytosine/adenosine deaminase-related metal-dependent hydrolase